MTEAQRVRQRQGQRLSGLLQASPQHVQLARWLSSQGPPEAWLAAGCVNQLVWNHLSGQPATAHFKDWDIVYFDPDLRASSEARWRERLQAAFPNLTLDVKNQARVHLWFAERFGAQAAIQPLASIAEALQTWPTTATATAARWHQSRRHPSHWQQDRWEILAPFGLDDLFMARVRPNPVRVSAAVYAAKTARWQACWPMLEILPFASAEATSEPEPSPAHGPG
ncbi:MAG: nucleotidyltransferase family protein [Candidatus Sericytochromatia bacterium]|nr:nucleotidyltransferase family protein [Candidatus Sericytochromatia bacterium]